MADLSNNLEGAKNIAQRFISTPWDHVTMMRELGEQERERDIFTSAYGMDDATRENLVMYFSQRGLGITPEVDEAIKNVSSSMVIDWSDQNNTDAVFGSITKALQNGGPAEAANVMRQMSEFYNLAMDSPTFNRTEMLNILGHWLKADIDPKELAVRTKSFLDTATRDWSDPMSAMGIDNPKRAESGRKARALFMNILASLSERPDAQQKVVTQGARDFQGYRQNLFRHWTQVGRSISPEVYNVMNWAGGWAGNQADFLGDYENPASNAYRWLALEGPAAALTVPQVLNFPFGGYGNNLSGFQPLRPQFGYGQTPGRRAASTESRFVRLAQRQNVVNPSISDGHITPLPNTPSNTLDGNRDAFQMDVMKGLVETIGSSDAADLTYKELLGTEKFRQLQQLKYDTARMDQNLASWEQDIRTGRGVSDLRLIEKVDQMQGQLAAQHDRMLSLYDEILAQVAQERSTVQQYLQQVGGQDQGLINRLQTYNFAISDISKQRNDHRLLRDESMKRAKIMSNELRFQARQVMEVSPLEKQRALLQETVGGDAGTSGALAAAQMTQGREKMQQVKRLQEMDPNVAGIQMGKSLGEAYDQYLQAIRNIDRGGQSAVPADKLTETLGV